ncbi:hypothetical protein DB346_21845 [Verrucomicrobia bacterium LW23]|nr:hypothetical protein DB346_21845 [Verrucomicrobia bacterium LW23]
MVIFAGLGIGYLIMKNQIARYAEQNRRVVDETNKLKEKTARLSELVADMKAPSKLRRRIEGMRLVNVNELQTIDMRDRVGVSGSPQPVSARLARTTGSEAAPRTVSSRR